MKPIDAVMTIEGGMASEDEIVAAYQTLIDQNIVSHLQGTYGRNAVRLIEMGLCTPLKGTWK